MATNMVYVSLPASLASLYAEIGQPSPSDGAGTPWGEVKAKLEPLVNGGWGVVLFLIIPAVLIAGFVFFLIGGFSGNANGMKRGRAILFSVPIGLFLMVIVRVAGNYMLGS